MMVADAAPPLVSVAVESIGPREARYLLRHNTRNRHLSKTRISTMARDMRNGEWVMNGESIKVSVTGVLLDGQHRLSAVVEADAMISSLVVRNLPDEAQTTVDTGSSRHMKDVLAMQGVKNAVHIAAAARTLWFFEKFLVPRDKSVTPSHAEIQAVLDDNPRLAASIPWGSRMSRSAVRYTPSMAIALHFLMSHKDAALAETFWSELATGDFSMSATTASPTFVLRETLLRDQRAPHKMSVEHRAALTIKAWNAVRRGEEMRNVGWRRYGHGSEAFPRIE